MKKIALPVTWIAAVIVIWSAVSAYAACKNETVNHTTASSPCTIEIKKTGSGGNTAYTISPKHLLIAGGSIVKWHRADGDHTFSVDFLPSQTCFGSGSTHYDDTTPTSGPADGDMEVKVCQYSATVKVAGVPYNVDPHVIIIGSVRKRP